MNRTTGYLRVASGTPLCRRNTPEGYARMGYDISGREITSSYYIPTTGFGNTGNLIRNSAITFRSIPTNNVVDAPTSSTVRRVVEQREREKIAKLWEKEITANDTYLSNNLDAVASRFDFSGTGFRYFVLRTKEVVGVFRTESEALDFGRNTFGNAENPYFSIEYVRRTVTDGETAYDRGN